ncbi:MAG: metallophosphoesterase, partial [Angustibacter sp.]
MMQRPPLAQSALALLGLGALGLAGCVVESRAYVLRYRTMAALPPGARPLRILHISDLHLTPGQRRGPQWLRGLARFKPDLVINTGDNLAHRAAVPVVLDALEPLLHLPGAFVLGSNDYFAPKPKNPARYLLRGGGRRRIIGERLPTADLVSGLESGGWLNLTNRRDQAVI